MNILYYNWYENSENDLCNTLIALGHGIAKINYPIQNLENDDNFYTYLQNLVLKCHFDCIFTFNYFPIISKVAQENHIKYISWIYDNPHFTLYSKTIVNSMNYIFAFDQTTVNDLKQRGAINAFHMPLAVNSNRINQMLGSDVYKTQYKSDISFVGNLYDNNLFDQVSYLPEYLKGYFNAIFDIQHNFSNCNIIEDSLNDSIIHELTQYINIDLPSGVKIPPKFFYQCMLCGKLTNIERIHYLNLLSQKYKIDLYTGTTNAPLSSTNITNHGYISYNTAMPEIFRTSKINLNITLRSIRSGIPLRAIDILGSGGFLLSNYQDELSKYFEDGKELVLFENESDLLEKIEYYLHHEEERLEIAANGQLKACKDFNYETIIQKMLSLSGLL